MDDHFSNEKHGDWWIPHFQEIAGALDRIHRKSQGLPPVHSKDRPLTTWFHPLDLIIFSGATWCNSTQGPAGFSGPEVEKDLISNSIKNITSLGVAIATMTTIAVEHKNPAVEHLTA